MTLIREHPPTRLMIDSAPPQGGHYRWAWDEPEPENVPQNLSFSTVMPGGFERMRCTLERDSRLFYADAAELSTITVYGVGGTVAWQGRLEKIPDTGGFQQQEMPEAVGYQAALEDDQSAREIYIDRDLSKWQGMGTTRRAELIEKHWGPLTASVAADESGKPAIVQTITTPWDKEATPIVEAYYDAKGISLGQLYYGWVRGINVDSTKVAPEEWTWAAFLSTNDITSSVDSSGNLRAAGPGSGSVFASATAKPWALLQFRWEEKGPAGSGGNLDFAIYWENVAVFGKHGLTAIAGSPSGFRASDVVAHAIAKFVPELAFTVGSEGTIQPSSFAIPQLAFLEPTTAAEMVKQATRFELQDWAVWEGPTFYMNDRGARGKEWRARVGPAQLQEAGPQVSRLWNGVTVVYSDVTGVQRAVGPIGSGMDTESGVLEDPDPGNPLNALGLKKWAKLQMGTSTPAGAEQVGAIFLRETGTLDSSGQATLVGSVEDTAGILWPAWKVRAGDTIQFLDAAVTEPRRIVHTDYNHDARANSLQLDVPPEQMQALLERMSAALIGTGLS